MPDIIISSDASSQDAIRASLIEVAFLISGSVVVLLFWTTSVYLDLEHPAVGLALALAGLVLIRKYEDEMFPEQVPTFIYLARFLAASFLNAAALATCGFRTLASGPGAPLRRVNRARWFDAYGTKGRYGPMIESYTGILCVLSYLRSMEYVIILLSRTGMKIKDMMTSD